MDRVWDVWEKIIRSAVSDSTLYDWSSDSGLFGINRVTWQTRTEVTNVAEQTERINTYSNLHQQKLCTQ